jgi:hypothetical protein
MGRNRTISLPQSGWQVLGYELNRSESRGRFRTLTRSGTLSAARLPQCGLLRELPPLVPKGVGGPCFRAAGAFHDRVAGYPPRARLTPFRLGPAFFTARFTLAFDFPVFFASYRTS